jgi:hypothetical protein
MIIRSLYLVCLIAIGFGTIIDSPFLMAESISRVATVPGLSGLATDKSGNIYALSSTSNTIVMFTASGQPLGTIGPLLPHGFMLRVSNIDNPIHIDNANRIYIASWPNLLILGNTGTVLNVDSDGKLLEGFRKLDFRWVGTSTAGDIYIYPAIDDEERLFSVITSTGQRLSSLGNAILPRGKPIYNRYLPAIDETDELYAVFDRFPKMLRYKPDHSFDGLIDLAIPNSGLPANRLDLSLEQTLQRLSEKKPIPGSQTIAFGDAEWIGDSLVCLSGNWILWYSKSGDLLRKFDYVNAMISAGYVAFFTDIVSGCSGHCLLGRMTMRDDIFRVDY